MVNPKSFDDLKPGMIIMWDNSHDTDSGDNEYIKCHMKIISITNNEMTLEVVTPDGHYWPVGRQYVELIGEISLDVTWIIRGLTNYNKNKYRRVYAR